MSIREKGYHKWDGELQKTPSRWWPIFRFTLRQIYNRRFAKALFAVELIPFLVFLFFSYIMYIANRPDAAVLAFLKELPPEIRTLDYFYYSFYCFGPTVFFQYVILNLFCGAELISSDLRSNAFSLYFSKPLTATDYLIGKFLSLLFFLLLFSLLPGFLLLLIKIAFSGFTDLTLHLLLGILFFPLIAGSAMAMLTLWISSLSANSRWVKVIFILFFLGLPAVGGIMSGVSGGDRRFMLLDIHTNIVQSGHFFFNVKSDFPLAPWLSVLLLLGLTAGLTGLIVRKIRKIEV